MSETNRIEYKQKLTRIYRDVELVESLGSGIPRILHAYGEDCFKFTDNFIRITLPVRVYDEEHDSAHESTKLEPSEQVNVQVKTLINSINNRELSVNEIMEVYKEVYKLVYKSKWYFKKHTIQPAILEGYVEMVYPDSPNHPNQKYRLTVKGLKLKEIIMKQKTNK